MKNNGLEAFLKLSSWLTDYPILPENIGAAYLKRLEAADGYKDQLKDLFELVIESKNHTDFIAALSVEQKNYCKGIVFLWYTSELIKSDFLPDTNLTENREGGSQEEYYSGLLWKVIRAHPPGLSGGYYGYWKYEPEN